MEQAEIVPFVYMFICRAYIVTSV